MALTAVHDEVTEMKFGPITAHQVEQFASATGSSRYANAPLTFPTIFRQAEFRWIDRLQIDLQQLLHTEQVYEYMGSLKEGDTPLISTRLADYRSRRGMLFVTLESIVTTFGKPVVKIKSSFVVRVDPDRPTEEAL